MGGYCTFCGRRCFVLRRLPDGHRCDARCSELGHTFLLATCRQGIEHDRIETGHDYRTAINPATTGGDSDG